MILIYLVEDKSNQDIANAILCLPCAQAEWITGNVLKVSGGHEL